MMQKYLQVEENKGHTPGSERVGQYRGLQEPPVETEVSPGICGW